MLFRYRNLFIFGLIFTAAVLLVISCSKDSTNPSEKEFVLRFFLAKCASQNGCHSTVDNAGGLDLTNYQDIMIHIVQTDAGPVRLVEPGNANGSFLYPILISDYLGKRQQPPDGPYLNANNASGVKTWIDEGALFVTD